MAQQGSSYSQKQAWKDNLKLNAVYKKWARSVAGMLTEAAAVRAVETESASATDPVLHQACEVSVLSLNVG